MRIISAFLFGLSASTGFAQSAKDYFFPAADKNLSVYKTNLQGHDNDGVETKIYYKNEGDHGVVFTQSSGATRTNGFELSNGAWEQSVKINDFEILAYTGKTTTSHGIETFDLSGEVIFKIPSDKDKSVKWENADQKGTIVQQYKSEFTKIKVNGKKRNAVKVTTILKRKRDGRQEDFYVDYYVEGIGRYQRTAPNKKVVIETLADQRYEPMVPTLSN